MLAIADLGRVVGAHLRQLRRDAELTQAQISLVTGIHRPIVSRIERGTHCLTIDTIERYAHALELDLATVLVCISPAWAEAGKRLAFRARCARPARPVPCARRARGGHAP